MGWGNLIIMTVGFAVPLDKDGNHLEPIFYSSAQKLIKANRAKGVWKDGVWFIQLTEELNTYNLKKMRGISSEEDHRYSV